MGSQVHLPAPTTTGPKAGPHGIVPPWEAEAIRAPFAAVRAHRDSGSAHASPSCLPTGRQRLEAVYLQVRDAQGPNGYTGKRSASRG
jgi:hypothetical protein